MMDHQSSHINDAVKPIAWLEGAWVSENGEGEFPGIKSFRYCEEMEFTSLGQPMLNYKTSTWNAATKKPMHLESGFLRVKPNSNQLAFVVAHNFGLTSVEEGSVCDQSINLESTGITRMSHAKPPCVTKIVRSFKLNGTQLQQVVRMETENTPLTKHLCAVYKRVAK